MLSSSWNRPEEYGVPSGPARRTDREVRIDSSCDGEKR